MPLFGSTITKAWYSDQTLFKNIKKLRDIDKKTNSPMLQKTEELFTLIQDFTEIRETLIGELDEEFDYIGNIGV
ncbi:hypothetical protein [Nostoc sp. UHCC 0252]|uniref:hypothetical protein n=1 Tax=Nostoc sp. UHCC 0252 TaxID=3110241 RepID=UPI002B2098CE|nr:hypothetical protein [Nostoc sp. UHCC 0252]MEA5602442.1 hypothetical protein [Nostoc sp. UHCC 0252]